jgi:hypothetical protein
MPGGSTKRSLDSPARCDPEGELSASRLPSEELPLRLVSLSTVFAP